VAAARALREPTDLAHRAPLAFVFPDEAWANEDLAASAGGSGRAPELVANLHAIARCGEEEVHLDADFPQYAHELTELLTATDLAEIGAQLLPESGADATKSSLKDALSQAGDRGRARS